MEFKRHWFLYCISITLSLLFYIIVKGFDLPISDALYIIICFGIGVCVREVYVFIKERKREKRD